MKTNRLQTLLVLTVLIVLVAAQQLFTLPGKSALMRTTHDAMHAPWFFALVVVLCWWFRNLAWPLRLLIVVGLGTVIAVGSEFAQLYVENRSASLGDLGRNLVGGVLGLVFSFALLPEPRPVGQRFSRVDKHAGIRFTPAALGISAAALLALAAYTVWPPWQALKLQHFRTELAPVLVDLADARTAKYVTTNKGTSFRIDAAGTNWPSYQGQPVLRLKFGASKYPTLYIKELMQRWAPYKTLAVDLFVLDDQPLPLTVAVRHEGSSGTSAYYESVLVPGENLLRIPRARLVPDDAPALRVRDLLIYSTAPHAGRTILLGAIRMD